MTLFWASTVYEILVPVGQAWRRSGVHTRESIEDAPDEATAIAQAKADTMNRRITLKFAPSDPLRVIIKPNYQPGKMLSCETTVKAVRLPISTDKGEFTYRFMVKYLREHDMGNVIVEKDNIRPAVTPLFQATSLADADEIAKKWYQTEITAYLPDTEMVKTEKYIVIQP